MKDLRQLKDNFLKEKQLTNSDVFYIGSDAFKEDKVYTPEDFESKYGSVNNEFSQEELEAFNNSLVLFGDGWYAYCTPEKEDTFVYNESVLLKVKQFFKHLPTIRFDLVKWVGSEDGCFAITPERFCEIASGVYGDIPELVYVADNWYIKINNKTQNEKIYIKHLVREENIPVLREEALGFDDLYSFAKYL